VVHEDPSTEATQKLPKERMFRKKSIGRLLLLLVGILTGQPVVGGEAQIMPHLQQAYAKYALEFKVPHTSSATTPSEFLQWMLDNLFTLDLYIKNGPSQDNSLKDLGNSRLSESMKRCRKTIGECRLLLKIAQQPNGSGDKAKEECAAALGSIVSAEKEYDNVVADVSFDSDSAAHLISHSWSPTKIACHQRILMYMLLRLKNSCEDDAIASSICGDLIQELEALLDDWNDDI
jgi:hypothetical protein